VLFHNLTEKGLSNPEDRRIPVLVVVAHSARALKDGRGSKPYAPPDLALLASLIAPLSMRV
jgi:hypothetical protein